jgi:hypothetical protein
MLVALCKYLFNVLPTIQHAHDLRDAVHDPIENNVRAGCERSESGAQLVSRSPGQRIVFNGGDYFADVTSNFFGGTLAGNALVVIPYLTEIEESFRRPNRRASASGRATGSFAG